MLSLVMFIVSSLLILFAIFGGTFPHLELWAAFFFVTAHWIDGVIGRFVVRT